MCSRVVHSNRSSTPAIQHFNRLIRGTPSSSSTITFYLPSNTSEAKLEKARRSLEPHFLEDVAQLFETEHIEKYPLSRSRKDEKLLLPSRDSTRGGWRLQGSPCLSNPLSVRPSKGDCEIVCQCTDLFEALSYFAPFVEEGDLLRGYSNNVKQVQEVFGKVNPVSRIGMGKRDVIQRAIYEAPDKVIAQAAMFGVSAKEPEFPPVS